jgi:uncharacterized protein with PIN domain
MGHICYTCKKELKWNMTKNTFDKLENKFNKIPPFGFSPEDKLCEQCTEKLLTIGSPESIARAQMEVKARLKKSKENSGIRAGECYWCKKYREANEFCFKSDWIVNDYAQCIECNKIIMKLSSEKMKELKGLENTNFEKKNILNEQEMNATYAETRANSQKYMDMVTGVANAGIGGGFFPNSDTQHLENSANQNKGSLKIQSINAKQETIHTLNLIKNERVFLSKKYFFNTNEAESKGGSPISIKASEDGEPIEILKVRLAKGEITLEEFTKIKENL